MKKIKFVKEDVLNGYIATDNKIIALVGTHRPDLDFDTLRNVIYAYNAYLDTGLAPREIIELKSNDTGREQTERAALNKVIKLQEELNVLKKALKIIYKDYENDSNRKIDSIESYVEVARDCVEFGKMMKEEK